MPPTEKVDQIIKAAEALVGYGLDLDLLNKRDNDYSQFIKVPSALYQKLYSILTEYHKENK